MDDLSQTTDSESSLRMMVFRHSRLTNRRVTIVAWLRPRSCPTLTGAGTPNQSTLRREERLGRVK